MSCVNDLGFKPPVLFRAVCFALLIPESPVYIFLEFANMPTGETVNVAGTQVYIDSILLL